MDAANIDLKGFDEQFYRVETGGSLSAVQRFLAAGRRPRAPGGHHARHPHARTMTRRRSRALRRFVASLGKDIPLHLSAYHPDYKYSIPATPSASIRELAIRRPASSSLRLRRQSRGEESDTACAIVRSPAGAARRVQRDGGGCGPRRLRRCGATVPIVGV